MSFYFKNIFQNIESELEQLRDVYFWDMKFITYTNIAYTNYSMF